MLKTMKRIFLLLGITSLFFIFARQTFALNCGSGIAGTIRDSATGTGIADAVITLFFNGTADTLHPVMSRADGDFTYGWPSVGGDVTITLTIVRSGYQSRTTSPLTTCTGNSISLISTGSTPPPGANPRCGSNCATDSQCSGATDGCTRCYSGVCINPASVPAPPPAAAPGPSFTAQGCLGRPDTVNTAIGCIPTTTSEFASFFLGYVLGIGGLVAFFLIVIAAFQILTSSGNPEKLEAGKQLLTAAVVGLLFIIFSAVILAALNLDILRELPGFPIFGTINQKVKIC